MRKFLIVDDNAGLADNLAEIVVDGGVGEAAVAADGERALSLAADTRFDALVSDVRMPRMDGIELFQRLRAEDPALPVVLMTAYTTASELGPAQQAGVLAILPKPVPVLLLLGILTRARRDGIVALVAPPAARPDSLFDPIRSNGFAPIITRSLAEAAALQTPLFAVVVDFRAASDPGCAALLLQATALPKVPIFAVDADGRRRQPFQDPGMFTAWSDAASVMRKLTDLSDGGGRRERTA